MAIASVLAFTSGGAHSESAVKTALSIGRAHDSYVEIMHVEMSVEAASPMIGEGFSGAAVEQILRTTEADLARRAATARRLYEHECVDSGMIIAKDMAHAKPGQFAAGWRHVKGDEGSELAKRGRLFDLIVLARPSEEEGGVEASRIEAALLETGRPVLLTSAAAPQFTGTSVMVAWDGSRGATRASSAALPFLARARNVTVVSVAENGTGPDPAALAQHLALHGIRADAHSVNAGNRKLGKVLLDEAARMRADVLVMGAYGHSPLRELVFGGATRDVLSKANIPVMFAH